MESEIRENLFWIPDPGVKKVPDPRSRSATLIEINPVGSFPIAGYVGRYRTVFRDCTVGRSPFHQPVIPEKCMNTYRNPDIFLSDLQDGN
jgi:hypothetical protein